MSFGVVAGLTSWGSKFTDMAGPSRDDGGRKRTDMIRRLYKLAVSMCLVLSFVSLPVVRRAWFVPTWLSWSVEVVASFILGASLAVPYYHVPALVAHTSTFGSNNRGLYVSLTDGVAFGLSSLLLRVLGGVVQTGDPQGYGWSYCWLDVSVVLVACSFVMVRFVSVFFRSLAGNANAKVHTVAVVPPPRLPRNLPSPGGPLPHRWGQSFAGPNDTGFESSVATVGGEGVARSHIPSAGRRRRRRTPDGGGGDAVVSSERGRGGRSDMMRQEDLLLFESTGSGKEVGDGSTAARSSVGVAGGREKDSETPRSPQELRERVLRLLDLEENQRCCDCPSPLPRWASIIRVAHHLRPPHSSAMMGCFLCQDCASAHRRMGVHVTVVRSVDHDDWVDVSQVEAMERGGNCRVNALYEAALSPSVDRGGFPGGGGGRERFVVDKYQRGRWFEYQHHGEDDGDPTPGQAHDVAADGLSSLVDDPLASSEDEDESGDDTGGGIAGGRPTERSIELVMSSSGGRGNRNSNTGRDFDAIALQMPSVGDDEEGQPRTSPSREDDDDNGTTNHHHPLLPSVEEGGIPPPPRDLLSDDNATVQRRHRRGEYDELPDAAADDSSWSMSRSHSKTTDHRHHPYKSIDEARTESLSDSSEDFVGCGRYDDGSVDEEGDEEDGLEEISFFPEGDEELMLPGGATKGQEVPYNPFSS